MIYLVTGGSASGKSEYAESLAVRMGGSPSYYIATMSAGDAESRRRIARHQAMRAGKGFTTVERYTDLAGLKLDCEGSGKSGGSKTTALLECMSNLVANEMYLPEGAGADTVTAVMQGLESLSRMVDDLVIVTNEVFSDGIEYDSFTREYLRILGEINAAAARMADVVVEVVYSVPVIHKGEKYVQFI